MNNPKDNYYIVDSGMYKRVDRWSDVKAFVALIVGIVGLVWVASLIIQ